MFTTLNTGRIRQHATRRNMELENVVSTYFAQSLLYRLVSRHELSIKFAMIYPMHGSAGNYITHYNTIFYTHTRIGVQAMGLP